LTATTSNAGILQVIERELDRRRGAISSHLELVGFGVDFRNVRQHSAKAANGRLISIHP